MKGIWLAVLTFACSAFTASITELSQPPQQQQHGVNLDSQQYEAGSAILDNLLAGIRIETRFVDAVLSRYDDASGSIRKKLAIRLVGLSFSRMAFALDEAAQQLRVRAARDLRREEEEKKDEDEDGTGNDCDNRCISEKMKMTVREMGASAKDSLLKLGLNLNKADVDPQLLSKQPAFLALSTTVLILNGIVGGALFAVSAAVNGLFIAIAAGIAYLGKLASDRQREMAGGPMGPQTFDITKLLDMLERFLNPPPGTA